MSEELLLGQLTEALLPEMAIIVLALLVLGFIIKKTPAIPDWLIVWILPVLGVMFAAFTIGFNIHAVLQGILAAGVAVLTNQLWKQSQRRD